MGSVNTNRRWDDVDTNFCILAFGEPWVALPSKEAGRALFDELACIDDVRERVQSSSRCSRASDCKKDLDAIFFVLAVCPSLGVSRTQR